MGAGEPDHQLGDHRAADDGAARRQPGLPGSAPDGGRRSGRGRARPVRRAYRQRVQRSLLSRPRPTAGRLVVAEAHTFTNRLIDETSPYLLQHAHNPVDWHPWGPEALEKARREEKPIFLSVGYSACHWCHVMEHESFENAEIARLLNESFVSIKVDREERPDLDDI